MSERNYEISEPFDDALNKRLNEYTGVVSQGKPWHDEAQELLPLPEDIMEARLEEARQEEREAIIQSLEAAAYDPKTLTGLSRGLQDAVDIVKARGEDNGEEGDSSAGAETEGRNVSPE